ncbi:hypothetical protein AMJ49_01305 [Parcubacteria bacterium DG_74_2]|nr:MAG: hypothetical protein AMJ49_01305 [Parcubacteria bacterium DG_74_2]
MNWYLTIGLWLSLLIEVWKIEKRLTEKDEKPPLWPLIVFGLVFLLAGVLHGARTLATPIHLYLFWAAIVRVLIYWFVSAITAKQPFSRIFGFLGQKKESHLGDEYHPRWKRIILFTVLIIILIVSSFFFVSRTIGYLQATAFRGSINEFQTGSIEMFPEIDPEDLRVITSGIARSIAEIKRTSAESFITSVHLGSYEDQLCFIATVSEKPWLGMLLGDSNRIREAIIVPVNDATGERAKVVPFTGIYAEGLWFGNGISVHANDMFPLRTFSRGYLTAMDQKLVVVTTSFIQIPMGPLIDPKVHVWDPILGNLIAEYSPQNAPEWIIQRWDESYLETMGDSFGDYRWTAANDLNYWTGLPVFSDRSADPSEPEGLRYQTWGEELTAVYLFDNKRNEQILELIMIATNEKLTLYSLDQLGLLSPDDAKELAIAGLPALPEGRIYSTPIALIYRIGTRLYYHIPIYIEIGQRYYPAYFALVDCQSRALLREETGEHGGMTPTVKALYEIVGGKIPTKEKTVEGILKDKDSWIETGNTRIWLTITTNETDVDVFVKAELLTPKEMNLLLDKEIGQPIVVKVDEKNVVTEVVG